MSNASLNDKHNVMLQPFAAVTYTADAGLQVS